MEEHIEITFKNHLFNKNPMHCKGCQEQVKAYEKRYGNINQKYLKEAQEIEGRWKKSGLLEGISDRWTRSATAVLLESQRLMNEQRTEPGEIGEFKRLSIPLRRTRQY